MPRLLSEPFTDLCITPFCTWLGTSRVLPESCYMDMSSHYPPSHTHLILNPRLNRKSRRNPHLIRFSSPKSPLNHTHPSSSTISHASSRNIARATTCYPLRDESVEDGGADNIEVIWPGGQSASTFCEQHLRFPAEPRHMLEERTVSSFCDLRM